MSERLWLPENIEVENQVDARLRSSIAGAEWLERELKNLDEYLTVEQANVNATDDRLVPGFWHVIRRSPNGDWWAWPLMDPDTGAYREPGTWVIDFMKARDMWSPDIDEKVRTTFERQRKAGKRKADLEREGMEEESAAVWRAAKRVPGDSIYKRRAFRGIAGS